MPLGMRTVTDAVHRTTITWEGPSQKDGGRALLLEAFNFIHSERQVGELIMHFGPGGSINTLIFEERERIPQSEVEVAEGDEK